MKYKVIEYRKGESWVTEFNDMFEAFDYADKMFYHLTHDEMKYNYIEVWLGDELMKLCKSIDYNYKGW